MGLGQADTGVAAAAELAVAVELPNTAELAVAVAVELANTADAAHVDSIAAVAPVASFQPPAAGELGAADLASAAAVSIADTLNTDAGAPVAVAAAGYGRS
jgi:hypothetical protein